MTESFATPLDLADAIGAGGPVEAAWRQELYRRLAAEDCVTLPVRQPFDCFAPSLCTNGQLVLQGSLGDYAFCNLQNMDVTILGNVGFGAGQAIRSGVLHIQGNAAEMCGANAVGGTISVQQNVGDYCAAGLLAADICVHGNAGNFAGYRMQGGALIIAGDCGDDLGCDLRDGVIYLRGKAASVSKSVYETRLREPDRLRLSLILMKANIAIAPKEFRVYRPE